MKKIFIFLGFVSFGEAALGQVGTSGIQSEFTTGSNVFLDASSNFAVQVGGNPYEGKGLVIPSVDLVNFEFDVDFVSSSQFQTIFDGMVVYNNATGTTLTSGNRSAMAVNVTPGFYYFSNPSGYDEYTNISGDPQIAVSLGQWIRIGSGGATLTSGPSNPTNGTGNDGDFYINTTTNQIFGPYNNGTWPAGTSLVGPEGPAGPAGTPGAPGAPGADGADGADGLLPSGTAVGNTTYWNGTEWVVNSNNIYNNGAGVGIGTGASQDASAKVEIASTTQGFLPPRMTTAQRNAIANPAKGLMIYNTTLNCLQVNDGTPASPIWNCISGLNLTLDTDGDGAPDVTDTHPNDPCLPAQAAGYTGYDAANAAWQAADCDGDGVTNGNEVACGSDPYNAAQTCSTDTDGDGEPDVTDSNPNDPCLPAQAAGYTGYDAANAAWQAADCDGDGVTNGNEVACGSDPYNAASLCPPPVPNTCNPSNPTVIVDVTNGATGKTWMDRNLGANRAAISSTDAQAYGSLYQWGRGSDGHQCVNRYSGDGVTTSGTTSTLSSSNTPGHSDYITINTSPNDWRSPQNTNLWQGTDGVNNPCPTGYRLPTETELNAERLSWASSNAAGAFASPLKLPMAGFRNHTTGLLGSVGSVGYYWSSTVSSTTSAAHNLYFVSNNAYMVASIRAAGFSVRCIKN